jgi:coiled-coil domain-containing protein 40
MEQDSAENQSNQLESNLQSDILEIRQGDNVLESYSSQQAYNTKAAETNESSEPNSNPIDAHLSSGDLYQSGNIDSNVANLPPLPLKVSSLVESDFLIKINPNNGVPKEEFEHITDEYVEDEPSYANITPLGRVAESMIQPMTPHTEHETEEDDDMAQMDPDHPLLERVQQAIYSQLSKYEEKLLLQVREREEQAAREIKRREDAGVELYTAQQHLAKLQAMYEGSEENLGIIQGLREESERNLKHAKSEYERNQDQHRTQQRNMEQHQSELEVVSRTLKKLDLYNEELRSKILVAKRTTLKSEKDIIQQEMEKKRQDFFIDHLTEKLRKLQEKRAMYDAQLKTQQKETNSAVQTLQDAQTEMEAIQFEKRQLLNQWKSSLMGLKKRDDMLGEIENAIQKNNEQMAIMNTEIVGFKRTLRNAQEEGENLTSVLNKLEHEMDYIKRQIAVVADQKDKLSDTYSMYMKSMAQTEKEMAQYQKERLSVQQEINAIQKAQMNNSLSIQNLEKEIAEKLKILSSFEKGAQISLRDGNKVRMGIHEKQINLSEYQNELVHVELESLNCTQRIDSMKKALSKVNEEIEAKNKLIEKYENEISQNNDALGKKASELDLLNKKYDQLTTGNEESNMGPLEATIYNLSKAIQAKEKECMELQQYWLRSQNDLVQMSRKGVEITDEIQTLRMRLAVLNRKKMVVNSQFVSEEKDIKEHARNIRHLQNEMVKVNTILSKQSKLYEKLEESNLEMENKFRSKLKDAELESVHMEGQLEELAHEKEQSLQQIIEAE